MTKIKIQSIFDIEFEVRPLDDSTNSQFLQRTIERHNEVLTKTLADLGVDNVTTKTKIVDPTKASTQVRVVRDLPTCAIYAYHSADGPALMITHLDEEPPMDKNLLQEVNAALREAHHKYLNKISED